MRISRFWLVAPVLALFAGAARPVNSSMLSHFGLVHKSLRAAVGGQGGLSGRLLPWHVVFAPPAR